MARRAEREGICVPSGLEVRLFGEVRVLRGGEDVGPGTRISRTLLAMLALSTPRPVGRDRLVEAVWGEHPPASAVNSLQAHLSRLRDVLEPDRARGSPSVIVSAGGGYRLHLDPTVADVGRFRAAVRDATSAEDWREACRLADEPPLGGCIGTWPVEAERRVLEEEHLTAIESWARAEIDEGNPEGVIGELERRVAEHPLRERLWALLVTALHAASRQSDALQTYQRARAVLVDTAGVEPGPELRSAQQVALDVRSDPPARSIPEPLRGVPAARVTLVGRDAEAEELADLLERWRLATVAGPGGSGKTQLAARVAREVSGRFPGAVVFVDLTRAQRADAVLAAVASAVGVRLVSEETEFVAVIGDRLRRDRSLLVLDNCEHVLDAVAELVDLLLDEVEPLTVLATSRAPLGVSGERVLPLGPLAAEDAVALFLERAEARRPGTARSASVNDIRELCRQLDGLPLAIELAAARADHLGVAEITEKVTATIEPLHRVDATRRDDRHRSLATTIRWSYDLLEDRIQVALRRLSVFRGPFDRRQAAAMVDDLVGAEGVDDVLGQLVAHSLLTVERGGSGITYRLLETIAAFARNELAAHDEVDDAERRHRDWYLAWARASPPGTTTLDLSQAYALERHQPDLLAALAHADRHSDVQALSDLAVFAGGLAFCPAGLPDAVRWLETARRRAEQSELAGRADLLAIGSIVGMLSDDIQTSIALAEEVVPLLDDAPDGAGPSAVALAMSFPEVSADFADVADELLRRDADRLRPALRLALEGMRPLATLFASFDAERSLREVAGTWEGRRWSDKGTMAAWTIHAALLHVNGEHGQLRRRLREMERVEDGVGPPTFFAAIFDALAAAVDGGSEEAVDYLRRTRDQHWHGIPGVASELLATLADIAVISGDVDRARSLMAVPGLRPRHPGTGTVHVWYRRHVGASIEDFVQGWWGRGRNDALIDLLDAELAAAPP